MTDIEKIAAKKFVELKGTEYLNSDKYNMSKKVRRIDESGEIEFKFLIAKAKPKRTSEITVDESIPWDETVSILVDENTGKCRKI